MRQAIVILMFVFITGATPSAPDITVRNYEECVKAGYPTGKAAGQERCWTPREFRTFVKGLKPSIRQGIYGTITLRSGNCMPMSSKRRKDGKLDIPQRPNPCRVDVIDSTVYIYPLHKKNLLKPVPYPPPDLTPVAVGRSTDGFYEIMLPTGSYSVLVEDRGLKSCRFMSNELEACPVTISTDEVWEYPIEINHASF
jgi:hypothetical protein